jgi:hypothetical protein
MSTYVYGGRDFKGNIVSNASMPSVAGAPGAWPAPVLNTNSGHAQWSTVNKKPYWWDTDTNTWVSYSDSGESFYGVHTNPIGPAAEIDCGASPVKLVDSAYDTISVPIMTALELADFPTISTEHPLVVDMSMYTGFTFSNGGAPQAEVYNRRGALIIRTTINTMPTGTTIYPGFAGMWYHGWTQPLGTNTLDGKLGPLTVSATVETPTMFSRSSAAAGYGIDAVDTHTILAIAETGDSCRIATRDAGVYGEVVTWQLSYDETNGLVFTASAIATNYHIMFTYIDEWAACADPFPGFDGRPAGYYTTYWF